MYWRQNTFRFDLTQEEVQAGIPLASAWLFNVGHKYMRHLGSLVISYCDHSGNELFFIELGHERIDGKPTLALKDLSNAVVNDLWQQQITFAATYNLAAPNSTKHDLTHIRGSINYALRQLFQQPDFNLASWCGHNLVGGLAGLLLNCHEKEHWDYHPFYENALEYIKGSKVTVASRDSLSH